MNFIDPHIHMVSRTTDDYVAMAAAGIVAVIEPAFWLGQPRSSSQSYADYLSTITGWERFRAEQFGIRHYCTIGLNSKEANLEPLAREVIELLPRYLLKESVVAVGEIGYDEQTAAEDFYFRAQLELAKDFKMPVQIHTPHRDKKRGTIRSMEVAIEHGVDPNHVVIDHNNEETVRDVLDRGFWAAFTIYPNTKMGNERMVEIVRRYGSDHIIVDSSADWGVSDPLAVPKTARARATATRSKPTANPGNSRKPTGRARRESTNANCLRAIRYCVARRRRTAMPLRSSSSDKRSRNGRHSHRFLMVAHASSDERPCAVTSA